MDEKRKFKLLLFCLHAEGVHPDQVIIKVDLACEISHKKIQKFLCKLQVKENIRSIAFDIKNNTVTIAGPFDPEKLSEKLKCIAGCVINSIEVKKPPTKPPPVEPKEPVATASASATVNLGFTQVCVLCSPWPCSDPISHCSHSTKQITHCEGVPAPVVLPVCTSGGVPCVGPCCRGGCGSSWCTGDGAHGCPARLSACRGCKGCRVVHPPTSCAIM